MGRYIARRLLQIIPVFFGATFLIYILVFAVPGDPVAAMAGERSVPVAVREEMRERYNLDDPLPIRYAKYIGNVFTGDLGITFSRRDVWDILKARIPVTLQLSLMAFAFELVLGLMAGVLAGLRKGSFLDSLVLVSTTAVISIPVFVLGYVAQLVFAVKLDWLPVTGGPRQGFIGYVMPAIVLGSLSLCYVARLTRTSLVENLRADYVRTATAKGLPRRRVVGRHALRNSLIPVITYLGVDLGTLMGGAIITEGIFNIPGIGREVFEAALSHEGPLVVGIVTFLVLVFMLMNLLVDIAYAALDPRIRYE